MLYLNEQLKNINQKYYYCWYQPVQFIIITPFTPQPVFLILNIENALDVAKHIGKTRNVTYMIHVK